MTIHCFEIAYSPSSSMDNYLSNWLNSWTPWAEETFDEPKTLEYEGNYPDKITASGFRKNRFELDDPERTPEEDAKYIVSSLVGQTGYLASYCDWWVVKWHKCTHDKEKRCGDWQVLDSSNEYSNQLDAPLEVIQ